MLSKRITILAILLPAILPILFTGVSIFNGPESPQDLTVEPPEIHDRVSDGVLLIVLDGLPAYVMDNPEYMPNLANWTDYGAKANVSTSEITLTGPCTKEMSTGIHSSPIDAMRNWGIQYDGKDDAFHYALDRNMSVAFTGFYVWANLFTDERFIHETVYDSGFSDVYDADDKIIANVNTWMDEQEHDLMVAHLGGTDHAGHMFGVKSEKYQNKMLHLDNQLNSIRERVPDNWTLMITADHGMTESGGHAISTGDMAMKVNLLLYGAGVEAGGVQDIVQRDIASIPLVLLDLPFPVSADSRIPLDLFSLTDEHSLALEQWNWQAQMKRQIWLEENGYPHAELSEDSIEWGALPSLTQTPSNLDILLSIIPFVGIAFLAYKHLNGKRVIQDNSYKILSLSVGYCILIMTHYIWFYDFEVTFWTNGWLRKSFGILSLIAVTGMAFYLVFFKSKSEDYSPPNLPHWSPYLLLAVTLWQPDSRLSPVLLVFCVTMIIYLRKSKTPQKNRLNSFVFMILILLPIWTIVNYYIGLIVNTSLFELTSIDFFYKIWQHIITSFMTDNLIAALILANLCMFIADRIYFGEKNWQWLRFSIPVSATIFLHSLGSSWIDRIVILWILFCVIQMVMVRIKHPYAIKSPFRSSWLEMFALCIIIPTWGAWPAMTTLLLVRTIPGFVENNLQWLNEPKEDLLLESCRKIVLGLMPWLLLCIVWTHYSLLTPMGLIEFNPSKIIVTGGFFGARVDPPILWMVSMVTLPLAISCTMVVNTWSKSGFDLFPAIILLFYMFVTNISNMWLIMYRPQVLLMIGFSSVVYLFWITCLVFGQSTITTILKGDGADTPGHAGLNK